MPCLRPAASSPPAHPTTTSPSSPFSAANGRAADSASASASAATSSAGPSSPMTLNLTREYTLAVQTTSYNEIWAKIQAHSSAAADDGQAHYTHSARVLSGLLRPDRDSVHQALRAARPSRLSRLVSAYFDNSEHASRLCLHLHSCIGRARNLYRPLGDLGDLFPASHDDSLTDPQLNWAFEVLTEFDQSENPFPTPGTAGADFREARKCFAELRVQLNGRMRRARREAWLIKQSANCSTICLIGGVIAVVASAVVIAVHALPALVAAPLLPLLRGRGSFDRRRLEDHIAQLDLASRGTFALNSDLDTIDRLVARLHAAVESDKSLVRLGLERGRERYPIQEVVKQLRKNQASFLHQLEDLEQHVCLCFATVNRARSLLLQEIHLDQTQPHC